MISALAGRQFGVVARRQLIEAGLTAEHIRTRLGSGRLVELQRGVYLVGAIKPGHADEMAALLACGETPSVVVRGRRLSLSHAPIPKAILSHQTAAALWGLLTRAPHQDVAITVPRGRTSSRNGIEVHHTNLHPRDIRRKHTMPLTSPPRTILDLAHPFSEGAAKPAHSDPLTASRLDALELLVAEASFRKLASEQELRDQLRRNPHKPGVRALRAVLALPGGPQRTRSLGERALLRLLRARRITGFEVNAKTHGYEVDLLWREHSFAVEVDGWDGHSSRVAFERDRLKWAKLEANGVRVMPITGRQVDSDPDGVVARLLAALASSRR